MKIYKLLEYIGLKTVDNSSFPVTYSISEYDLDSSTDSEKIKTHKDFLLSALAEEHNRLGLIENKTSQIVSQTSIVFSVVGLFIPVIIDKSDEIPPFLKIVIIVLVLLAFAFYLLTINNALKNFQVSKFKYAAANPKNVIDFKAESLDKFNVELVRDYLYSIDKNIESNNIKATNLIHSHNSFKIANMVTGILMVIFCGMVLFKKNNEEKITLNPIKINNLDSILNKNKPIIIYKQDTLIIRDTIFVRE